MSRQDEAQIKMDEILFGYGLQTTLVTLIKSIKNMKRQRGFTIESTMIEEGLKGLLKGYLRRYDEESPLSEESIQSMTGIDEEAE